MSDEDWAKVFRFLAKIPRFLAERSWQLSVWAACVAGIVGVFWVIFL